MPWLSFQLALDQLDPEPVEDALLAAGAVSVTYEDAGDEPLYEPEPEQMPLWSRTRMTGLFAAETDMDAVRAVLLASLGLSQLPMHRIESLEDRDWAREWLKDFKPMRFGRRLWICPTAYAPPEPDAINILLDPGLAFGTGTHPTTALCLERLDACELQDHELVDYGCGSGVLAIAAARLGASRVWAVDTDPQALVATRDNAGRNQVESLLRVSTPEALPALQADFLVANILAGPLVALASRLAALLKAGGELALSGILATQEQEIRDAYAPWFEITGVARRDEWLRVDARRRELD
ncbi:MAG TPA: 50S ribosomal protein L11 methyltransferase [Gammaproteobacteria bacterium]|nr:50S ribosomal protein L11 methyltransferase [Gammaproteobacteria bacterium]